MVTRCSVCDAELSREAIEVEVYEDSMLKINTVALVLGNGIGMNFAVYTEQPTKTTFNDYTDQYVVFKKAKYDLEGNIVGYDETTVTLAEATDGNNQNNGATKIFALEGIFPQELGSAISATVYGMKDGHLYTGNTTNYSALTYIRNQIAGTGSDKLKTVCADLAMYGEAVQTTYPYNTANIISEVLTTMLANDKNYTKDWKALYATAEDPTLEKITNRTPLEGANIRILSAGLTLEDKVVINIGVSDMDKKVLADYSDLYLKVSYSGLGGDKEYTFDNFDPTTGKVAINTLYATEMSSEITMVVMSKSTNQPVGCTMIYSIESYAQGKQNDATLGKLVNAMMKYGNSAYEYAKQ